MKALILITIFIIAAFSVYSLGCCIDQDGFYHNNCNYEKCKFNNGIFSEGTCPGADECIIETRG